MIGERMATPKGSRLTDCGVDGDHPAFLNRDGTHFVTSLTGNSAGFHMDTFLKLEGGIKDHKGKACNLALKLSSVKSLSISKCEYTAHDGMLCLDIVCDISPQFRKKHQIPTNVDTFSIKLLVSEDRKGDLNAFANCLANMVKKKRQGVKLVNIVSSPPNIPRFDRESDTVSPSRKSSSLANKETPLRGGAQALHAFDPSKKKTYSKSCINSSSPKLIHMEHKHEREDQGVKNLKRGRHYPMRRPEDSETESDGNSSVVHTPIARRKTSSNLIPEKQYVGRMLAEPLEEDKNEIDEIEDSDDMETTRKDLLALSTKKQKQASQDFRARPSSITGMFARQSQQRDVVADLTLRAPGGLRNTGNSCYANAVLQVLVRLGGFTRDVREYLRDTEENETCQPREGALAHSSWREEIAKKYGAPARKLVAEFLKVVDHAARSDLRTDQVLADRSKYVYNARSVKDSLAELSGALPDAQRFASYSQQDSHEFMKLLLEGFEIALGPRLFRNHLLSTVKESVCCDHCPYTACQTLEYQDVSLFLPSHPKPKYDHGSAGLAEQSSAPLPPLQLSDLVNDFLFHKAAVSDFTCERCSQQGAKQNAQPEKMAKTLILHIKRFSSSGRKRSNRVVADPSMTIHNSEYSLKGIVFHVGQSLGFGHYYAAVLDTKSLGWTVYNDKMVVSTTQKELLMSDSKQRECYMFIYEKKKLF